MTDCRTESTCSIQYGDTDSVKSTMYSNSSDESVDIEFEPRSFTNSPNPFGSAIPSTSDSEEEANLSAGGLSRASSTEMDTEVPKADYGTCSYCKTDKISQPLFRYCDRCLKAMVQESSGILYRAAEAGDEERVRSLIAFGAKMSADSDDDDDDEIGETALHAAARAGHYEVVKLLLDAGHPVTESADRRRHTLLHMVAHSRRVDIAKELLKRGADINAADGMLHSPLEVACYVRNSVMTEFLLEEGADVNEEGGMLLELAVRDAGARCVEVVEKHCAKLRAANFRVSSPRLGLNASADFRGRCDAEVEKLKGTGVDGASVYDVLVSDVDRAALLLRNDDLRGLVSQDLTGIFPIYSSMIERAVKKATEKLLLIDDATEAIEALTRGRLPTEILREVTKYLSDRDLNAVVAAYRGPHVCDP